MIFIKKIQVDIGYKYNKITLNNAHIIELDIGHQTIIRHVQLGSLDTNLPCS